MLLSKRPSPHPALPFAAWNSFIRQLTKQEAVNRCKTERGGKTRMPQFRLKYKVSLVQRTANGCRTKSKCHLISRKWRHNCWVEGGFVFDVNNNLDRNLAYIPLWPGKSPPPMVGRHRMREACYANIMFQETLDMVPCCLPTFPLSHVASLFPAGCVATSLFLTASIQPSINGLPSFRSSP